MYYYHDLTITLHYMWARATMTGYGVLVSGGGSLEALRYFKFANECKRFCDDISEDYSAEIQRM